MGFFDSPVGRWRLHGNQQALCGIDFYNAKDCAPSGIAQNEATLPRVAHHALAWLHAYFQQAATPRPALTLQCPATMSAFALRVLHALLTIRCGDTTTYSALAASIGEHTGAAQAVGQILKRNPFSVLVPCHRVIAKQGIGGFGGETAGINIQRKRWLLAHEGCVLK